MADYKILNKTASGCGNIGYVIEVNGQEYIADITIRNDKDYLSEFFVFKSVNHQITFDNALPIFTKEDVSMDFSALEECINEFVKHI